VFGELVGQHGRGGAVACAAEGGAVLQRAEGESSDPRLTARPFDECDVNEAVIGRTFAEWQIEQMERAAVPSDTRMLDVLLVRLATRS
jgi:hypothetical protein